MPERPIDLSSRASYRVWIGTLLAAVFMCVLVWLTSDDGLGSHWIEISGAVIGVHIALRFGQRDGDRTR